MRAARAGLRTRPETQRRLGWAATVRDRPAPHMAANEGSHRALMNAKSPSGSSAARGLQRAGRNPLAVKSVRNGADSAGRAVRGQEALHGAGIFWGSCSHLESLTLTDQNPPVSSAPSDARWSSLVARRAHNPKVVGSNPSRATKRNIKGIEEIGSLVFFCSGQISGQRPSKPRKEASGHSVHQT